jgi:hypothetical protein
MGTYSKIVLSGSTNGQGVVVTGDSEAATPTKGVIVHTAVTGTAASIDEVWTWVWHSATTTAELTVMMGVTTATGSRFTQSVTADDKKGLVLVTPGLVMNGAIKMKFSATADTRFNVFGYVNRYAS